MDLIYGCYHSGDLLEEILLVFLDYLSPGLPGLGALYVGNVEKTAAGSNLLAMGSVWFELYGFSVNAVEDSTRMEAVAKGVMYIIELKLKHRNEHQVFGFMALRAVIQFGGLLTTGLLFGNPSGSLWMLQLFRGLLSCDSPARRNDIVWADFNGSSFIDSTMFDRRGAPTPAMIYAFRVNSFESVLPATLVEVNGNGSNNLVSDCFRTCSANGSLEPLLIGLSFKSLLQRMSGTFFMILLGVSYNENDGNDGGLNLKLDAATWEEPQVFDLMAHQSLLTGWYCGLEKILALLGGDYLRDSIWDLGSVVDSGIDTVNDFRLPGFLKLMRDWLYQQIGGKGIPNACALLEIFLENFDHQLMSFEDSLFGLDYNHALKAVNCLFINDSIGAVTAAAHERFFNNYQCVVAGLRFQTTRVEGIKISVYGGFCLSSGQVANSVMSFGVLWKSHSVDARPIFHSTNTDREVSGITFNSIATITDNGFLHFILGDGWPLQQGEILVPRLLARFPIADLNNFIINCYVESGTKTAVIICDAGRMKFSWADSPFLKADKISTIIDAELAKEGFTEPNTTIPVIFRTGHRAIGTLTDHYGTHVVLQCSMILRTAIKGLLKENAILEGLETCGRTYLLWVAISLLDSLTIPLDKLNVSLILTISSTDRVAEDPTWIICDHGSLQQGQIPIMNAGVRYVDRGILSRLMICVLLRHRDGTLSSGIDNHWKNESEPAEFVGATQIRKQFNGLCCNAWNDIPELKLGNQNFICGLLAAPD